MSAGSGSGPTFGAPGSQNGQIPEPYGVDPSIAPGLPRPQGWRVALLDGTGAWDKTGPLDTDWTPVTAAALVGVTRIVAGTNVDVTPPSGTGVVTINVETSRLVEEDLTNAALVDLPGGTVVHLVGSFLFDIAQADSAPNAAGVVGVTMGLAPSLAQSDVVIGGEAFALVDPAVVALGAGEQVWLSAAAAGTVTNVKPASNAVHIGVVKAVGGSIAIVDLNIYVDATPGDVTGATATDAGIVLTNAGGPVIGIGQQVAAEWPIANMRVYAVDFVNGNDANAGFADAAGTSSGQYATACAAAGAAAKKTIAGLAAIFPRVGNGRLVEIVIANGGVNTEQAYADSLGVLLNGTEGYAQFTVRGTGTNTTAGAVAFAGTTNDVDFAGGITATGCNAAGYNPTGTPTTTTVQCLKVGGGAAAIPAEPAAPLGWRIRFDNATATAALRNISRSVSQVTGTDTIVTQSALPAAPAAGDVFYLEQAGVALPASTLVNLLIGAGQAANSANLVGLRFTGTLLCVSVTLRIAFCGANAFNDTGIAGLLIAQTYTHPVLGTRTPGGGLRSETTCAITQVTGGANCFGMVSVGTTTFTNSPFFTWNSGSYAAGLVISGCQHNGGTGAVNAKTIGNAGAPGIPRVKGARLQIVGSIVLVGFVDITNVGANPAIDIRGAGNVVVMDSGTVASGSTGNTGAGIAFSGEGSMLVLAGTPTVTGTAGNMQLRGGQILTWAAAIATGIVDSAGNRILGTAGAPPMGMDTKTGGIFTSLLGAVFSYIADERPIAVYTLAANSIGRVSWATSQRLMLRMWMQLLDAGPSVVPFTATLYKNGVATAMVCTMPAGSAIFTKVVDAAHPIYFADGDDWAIRLDAAQAGGEGSQTLICGVTVEWAA